MSHGYDGAVIVARSTDPRWLSNAWLLAAGPGGPAAIVDAGAPPRPLLDAAAEHGLAVQCVLLTHHHGDHVSERAAFGAPAWMHALDAEHVPGVAAIDDGAIVACGALRLRVVHVPGHTRGQINVVAECEGETPRVFTGDTLFRGSVGGTRAPGHGTFAELRSSILDRLMTLPPETIVHAGHGDDTTIGREAERNAFVRAWRGEVPTMDEPCEAFGEPATLLLWERDYDGGHKAWVRWRDGREDTVPGSRVARASSRP